MNLSPEQVQAVNVLISAINVAQKRGVYTLKEAQTIQTAIDLLVVSESEEQTDVEVEDAED